MNDTTLEIKRILYQSDNGHLCDICRSESAVYLNMSPDCHNEACQSCLEKHLDDGPVQLNFNTGELVCFQCMKEGHAYKVRLQVDTVNTIALSVLNYIKSADIEDELNCRRKAEHTLYVQELRREDMSIKHYLIEKQWGRSWMLFRTREGSPLPGRISNHKLARSNGTLDPNIRLPMDKYRPSPETHGDIISERLWNYLSHAYGVQGSAYSEDDIIAPEYARLRVYVDDFKKSIHLYP
ncbi:hypothetical protein BDB01DRAFT_712735 [Pilobolus umbonatus]|nr:hypothetical protein BDB01DRAFT_712735 [Pilobolus umbonatus]